MNDAGWVALLVASVTSAGGLYTAYSTKRKVDADSESVSIVTMRGVLKEVRLELSRCHDDRATFMGRLDAAEKQNRELKKRVDSLEAYLKLNHGIDPDEINGEPV